MTPLPIDTLLTQIAAAIYNQRFELARSRWRLSQASGFATLLGMAGWPILRSQGPPVASRANCGRPPTPARRRGHEGLATTGDFDMALDRRPRPPSASPPEMVAAREDRHFPDANAAVESGVCGCSNSDIAPTVRRGVRHFDADLGTAIGAFRTRISDID